MRVRPGLALCLAGQAVLLVLSGLSQPRICPDLRLRQSHWKAASCLRTGMLRQPLGGNCGSQEEPGRPPGWSWGPARWALRLLQCRLLEPQRLLDQVAGARWASGHAGPELVGSTTRAGS